jgi:tryptophanyl-tRNA synthetase
MKDKQVQIYSNQLTKLGIEHKLFEHPQLISVDAVQKYLGYGMEDSAATLLMKADSHFIAIIRRGDTKLDSEKVKKLLGIKTLRKATDEEFTKVTGVPSGAASVYIPNVPTYIDKKIFEKEYINAGSGSLLVTIRYKSEDLKKIPGIVVADITDIQRLDEKKHSQKLIGQRLYSAITPSGDGTLHIGNYLGAVRQFIELAKNNECFFQIASLHALSTVQNKEKLEKNVETLVLNELALLGDAAKVGGNVHFCFQPDVFLHTELQSIINNVTPLGLLKRAHAYKDKLAKDANEEDINLGLFNYPILMAADILIYKATCVPVGKDQKQHVEITRDIAERFNKTFKKNVFPLPEPYIPEEVSSVLGTDGKRKMSKSLGNIISIFESEEVIRKQVNSTYTDPTRMHATDPGHIEGNMVFTYLDFFGDEKQVASLKEEYKKGKISDVAVKEYLFETLMKTFGSARERYEQLKNNPKMVNEILASGTQKAREVASKTMEEVRRVVGITNQYSISSSLTVHSSQKSITIDEFSRIEMRVGKVEAAENVEKSEKLIRLHVDFGEIGKRIIFTGVRGYGYKPEDFIGKQFFFVVNLEYRKMMGEESQGMILAVDLPAQAGGLELPFGEHGKTKPIFVSADGLSVGAKIR